MYIFLKSLFRFILTFLISSFTLGIFIELYLYVRTSKNQYLTQADWHINHIRKPEIIFLGNSRIAVQLDACLFTSQTKKISYALTQDGRGNRILYHKLKSYLKINGTPKVIYMQLDPTFLFEEGLNNSTFYGKENYISYLYVNNLGINMLFADEKGFEVKEVYIPLLRYLQYPELFVSHLFGYNNLLKDKYITSNKSNFKFGTYPQDWEWGKNPHSKVGWKTIPQKMSYRVLNFQYCDSIFNLCRVKGITLRYIYPPQSSTSYIIDRKKYYKQIKHYVESKKLDFEDFNCKREYSDSSLFYNHLHLNKKGSVLFTIDVIHSYFSNNH